MFVYHVSLAGRQVDDTSGKAETFIQTVGGADVLVAHAGVEATEPIDVSPCCCDARAEGDACRVVVSVGIEVGQRRAAAAERCCARVCARLLETGDTEATTQCKFSTFL